MKKGFCFALMFMLKAGQANSQAGTNEMCQKKYCYSWDGEYERPTGTEKCKDPYWVLEIYDDDVLKETTEFIHAKSIEHGYYVPLGMTCGFDPSGCRWNSRNKVVTFHKFGPGVSSIKENRVYFAAGSTLSWFFDSRKDLTLVTICMRSPDSSSSEHRETTRNSNVFLVGIVLGLASLALMMLLIAMMVLLLKRKRRRRRGSSSRKHLAERTLSSESQGGNSGACQMPVASRQPPPRPLHDIQRSVVGALPRHSTMYANSLEVPSRDGPGVTYAELDWSGKSEAQRAETPAGERSVETDEVSRIYENDRSNTRVLGPQGDEYSVVNQRGSRLDARR